MSGIAIGIFLFLGSLDIKFKIYNMLLRVLLKSSSFIIKNVFQNFYTYTKKLTEIFIYKKKISQEIESF